MALCAPLCAAVLSSACASGDVAIENDGDDSVSAVGPGSGGSGGATSVGTGGTQLPCGVDCAAIATPQCQVAQCNMTTMQCEVVNDEDGVACDDGLFCTISDSCLDGMCVGGPQNDCGMAPPACTEVTCDEQAQTCSTAPSMNGAPCQEPDLCIKGSMCSNGLCLGGMLDNCFFEPVPNDCHVSVCDSADGVCKPEFGNFGGPCNDLNDLCTVGKTCDMMGNCQGGMPKDCSFMTQGCNLGVCDTTNGNCTTMAVMNGQPCDDLDPCTTGETCNNMNCTGGAPVTTCMGGDFCCPSNCNDTNDLDCASCDWNPALFPIPYTSTNSVGDMTFDANCNLYFGADGGELFRVTYQTTNLQMLHDFGTRTRGVAFNPNDGLIYVAVNDAFHRITTAGTNPTALPNTNVGTYVNGMVLAPPGWGAYGGHLLVAHSSGNIYAVNPAGGAPVVVGTQSGNPNDTEMDYTTGTLYVSVYTGNTVYTMSPTGVFTPFSSGLGCSPDGLAIDEGQTLFVACGGSNQLHKLTIPGGVPTLIGSASLSSGWAPVGMIYDGLDNLIVMEDGQSLQVHTP